VPFKLKCRRKKDFVNDPTTVGEHLRKRRRTVGLTLKEAGRLLGVTDYTLINWEQGKTKPAPRYFPAIARFLGPDPFPETATLSECLLRKRQEMGWTIRQAATAAGVDPGTWRDWEAGKIVLYRKHRKLIARLLDLDEQALATEMRCRWNAHHERRD
jgi:transcriptional regulator with XRE-family HTH domain